MKTKILNVIAYFVLSLISAYSAIISGLLWAMEDAPTSSDKVRLAIFFFALTAIFLISTVLFVLSLIRFLKDRRINQEQDRK
ncbi:MAG: hypothetical protein PHP32_06670 [Candidatus Izemoplasmatales bacterium]|nr:hypothetical protein [Candidatus Izemoplasmatales bacterium]